MNLYSFTSSAEGGLQIVEQILPFFQPEYTVTMNVVPEMSLVRDIPIILNNVNYEDTYNGEFTRRRAVIYTLNFTAKTYLFGPDNTSKTIKEVKIDHLENKCNICAYQFQEGASNFCANCGIKR